jgi:hypothetical protein
MQKHAATKGPSKSYCQSQSQSQNISSVPTINMINVFARPLVIQEYITAWAVTLEASGQVHT